MRNRLIANLGGIVIVMAVTMVVALGASATFAAPPAETVHYLPTLPAATPAAAGGGGGTGFLAVLEGTVWEEGDTFRPLAGAKVRYTSDGVSVDVTTDKNGTFKFVNVGADPGVLDLADGNWQSGTGGVLVKPPLGQTVRINLAALTKGKSVASKVTLASSASAASASAGQMVTFTLKVTNGTSSVASGLTLGDQLPDGVTVAGVTTSRGDVIGRGPSLVTVDLGALAAGDSATVNVVATVNKTVAAMQTANRATLFYREGPSISTQAGMTVAGGPATLPVTGSGLPIVAVVTLVVILLVARTLRVKPAM
jgi:uncharacterized repeat protein (TIGR01451 family)